MMKFEIILVILDFSIKYKILKKVQRKFQTDDYIFRYPYIGT